ncbi:XopG/HopH/AvrPtoH family type III secretion system effector [Xanthomonas oryzae]|nr:XopG/HopH/AvrPtoH family type III secretion system effector [Xanthomonas oryzae]
MDASSFRTNSVSHLWCVVQRFLSARKNRKVTIAEIGAEAQPNNRAVLSASEVEKYDPEPFADNLALAKERARKGKGCNAIIEWSPHSNIELNSNGSPLRLGSNPEESFVVLAHELIHAQHILAGTSKAYNGGDRYDETSEAGKEELRAVGVGKYEYRKTRQPSENSIRQEHGLPIRKKYKPHGR